MTIDRTRMLKSDAGGTERTNASMSPKVQTLGKRLVMQLATVLKTSRIHDTSNQAMLIASETLKDTINTLWAALGPIRLQFVQDVVYLNDVRLRIDAGMRDQLTQLHEEFESKSLGGLVFQRPVDTNALKAFLAILSRPAETKEDVDALKKSLVEMKELAMELLDRQSFSEDDVDEVRIDKKTFGLQTYAKVVIAARECVAAMSEGRDPLSARLPVTRIIQDLIDIATERVNFLIRLGSIKTGDSYVANHAANTCVLSLVVGKALGIPRVRLVDLGVCALLADLAFALVDPALLDDTRELSEAERAQVREAMIGKIHHLLSEQRISDNAMRRVVVAHQHHLPLVDPVTGRRNRLDLYSRIVAVADAYDALTTKRPWREGFTPDEALKILARNAGSRYDPVVVKILVNLMGLYPLGSAVVLGSGEIAVVYHNSNDPKLYEKPWVRLLRDPSGERIKRTVIRNLAEHSGTVGRIVRMATREEIGDADASLLVMS